MDKQGARSASELTILRRRQVEKRTGLSRSALYKMVSEGSFPRQINLGPRAVGWIEAEVSEWIAAKVNAGRN